jgi:anti-sigma factor RsiW
MDHQQATETLAIERYILGEMSQEEQEAFEAHFFTCAECAEDARAASQMVNGVAAGLARSDTAAAADGVGQRREVLPFRAAPSRWRTSIALPWAAAALLAVGLGYQTIEGPVLSRHDTDSFALTPATLRPASRGQEAIVSPGPGGVVTLAVDLGGAQVDDGLSYEVVREDGKTIASGKAPMPVAGAPLLLMLPAAAAKSSERYALTLHDQHAIGLTLATYRFRVKTQ